MVGKYCTVCSVNISPPTFFKKLKNEGKNKLKPGFIYPLKMLQNSIPFGYHSVTTWDISIGNVSKYCNKYKIGPFRNTRGACFLQ